MCYQEIMLYHCGHRSMGVLRPCPLTTAGHNFPVCTHQLLKKHHAMTMCPACERLLHTRWVLIREWEHRWLHERGACGCEVVFPGLLTKPRVIGDVAGDADVEEQISGSSSGRNQQPQKKKGESSKQTTAKTSHNGNGKGKRKTTDPIPPLYSETTINKGTDSAERHVAIRLPSLYAAEWTADHRALHKAGRCKCPADFRHSCPEVEEQDMDAAELDLLRAYRDIERLKSPLFDRMEIAQRIDQIGDIFGATTLPDKMIIQPTSTSVSSLSTPPIAIVPVVAPLLVNPPPLVTAPDKPELASKESVSAAAEDVSQKQERPAQSELSITELVSEFTSMGKGITGTSRNNTPRPKEHPHQKKAGGLPDNNSPSAKEAAAAEPSGNSYTHQQATGSHALQTGNTFGSHSSAANTPRQLDPLPYISWNSKPAPVQNAPWLTYGPGPFVSSGLDIPGPEDTSTDIPLCGLPVGAGPEGDEPHMPPWQDCRLSRLVPRRRRSLQF
ncbi:hypothetical protein B0H63DRAFT_530905 [Podospora didyma]|uniref:Uncharacterized protein n=1 Tax=Podospora didyma TaxID=330526 RepID=A0AAE0U7B2_9PEZI|nr:hypothetical protein B0H63DRAFT_530905 [Podospora didyma]